MKTFREIAEMHYKELPSNDIDRQYRLNRVNALEKLLKDNLSIPLINDRKEPKNPLKTNFC